jgi:hypothetical protein
LRGDRGVLVLGLPRGGVPDRREKPPPDLDDPEARKISHHVASVRDCGEDFFAVKAVANRRLPRMFR